MAYTLGLIVFAIATVFLYFVARHKTQQNQDLQGLFAEFQGVSGFDNIMKIITKKVAQRTEVLDFFKLSEDGKHLQGLKEVVSALEPSAPVNAFYNLMPAGLKRKSPVDATLAKRYGWDATFIPIAMKGDAPCWKQHDCKDKKCSCHRKNYPDCWVKSDTRYRGEDIINYRKKAMKCLSCGSFLPLGVFVTQGGNQHDVHQYLSSTFSSILSGGVKFDRAVYLSQRDPLTGLYNKGSFKSSLSELVALSKRNGRPLTLCLFDIDHFKNFNDTYGHPAGDALLIELARLVLDSVRSSDVCARYGGEEFTILFPETDKDTAFAVADKFRAAVADHKFLSDKKPPVCAVTISLGIATYPGDAETAEDLVEHADLAMYHGKHTGRNKTFKYTPKLAAAKV